MQAKGAISIRGLLKAACSNLTFCLFLAIAGAATAQTSIAADSGEAQRWRDAQALRVVAAYEAELKHYNEQLAALRRGIDQERTNKAQAKTEPEKALHQRRIDLYREREADLEGQIAKVQQSLAPWRLENEDLRRAHDRVLEAEYNRDKQINALKEKLREISAREPKSEAEQDAYRRDYHETAQAIDRLRKQRPDADAEQIKSVYNARFERAPEDTQGPTPDINVDWVDRNCNRYDIGLAAGTMRLTRRINAGSFGTLIRTYEGAIAADAPFRIAYTPDKLDLKVEYKDRAASLSDEDFDQVLASGIRLSANAQFFADSYGEGLYIWPSMIDIAHKTRDDAVFDVSVSPPRLSEVAIELRPDTASLRHSELPMAKTVSARTPLDIQIVSRNESLCHTFYNLDVKVVGIYVDGKNRPLDGVPQLEARFSIFELPPRGWERDAGAGPHEVMRTIQLVPPKPGRVVIATRAVRSLGPDSGARSDIDIIEVTADPEDRSSVVIPPEMSRKGLAFLDNLDGLASEVSSITDRCLKADRITPRMCQSLKDMYLRAGALERAVHAMEQPMLSERDRVSKNAEAYLERAQINQEQLYWTQLAQDIGKYYLTWGKGFSDLASAASFAGKTKQLKQVPAKEFFQDLSRGVEYIFSALDNAEKVLDYGDKLRGESRARLSPAFEKLRKFQEDLTKSLRDLEKLRKSVVSLYQGIDDNKKMWDVKTAARTSILKLAARVFTYVAENRLDARARRIAADIDTIASDYAVVDDRILAMREINGSVGNTAIASVEATDMFGKIRTCFRRHCGDDSALFDALPAPAANASPKALRKAAIENTAGLKTRVELVDE